MKTQIKEYILKAMKLKSSREYKVLKRKQIRAVEKAVNDLRTGSVCLPDYPNSITSLSHDVSVLKESMSVKNWGR